MQQKQYLRQNIQKAFTQYSQMPLDTLLDEKNYIEFLDFLAQKKFDREIGLELFNTCPKKQNKFITIDDFIDVFFKAEDELVRQISVVNQKINSLNEQREDLLVKIQDDQSNHKAIYQQQQNLMQIKIDVQMAQIARSSFQVDNQAYYILAECSGLSKSTEPSQNFYFNQTLQISVNHEAQYLNLYLFPSSNQQPLGQIQMNIQNFPQGKDLPFQEFFQSSSGQQIPIFLQYIINIQKSKSGSKYEDKYNEKSLKIQEKENQLKEIDSNLKTLYLLIRNLDQINSKNANEVKDMEQYMRINKNIEYLKNSPNKSQQLQEELKSREQLLMSKSNNKSANQSQLQQGFNHRIFSNKYEQDEENNQNINQKNQEIPYSYDERILIRNFKIAIGIFLIISILQNFEKPAFIEIGALLGFISLLCTDELDEYYTLFLSLLIIIQLCIDFAWTMIYDLTDYYERYKAIDNENQKVLMIFCYIVMVVGFFYKFFFMHMAFIYYNNIAVKLQEIKSRNIS
ncbi:transmembrane protein, putative (macronuclear) [Tetrahymena thermophila SB210]|uniref:Transmembrane protein, putative n=1 Tax=Tetrahymena thermophila (strain SB210) TaxID=312017 RepID=I7M0U4_TETTS|nr:transmembrane protein, putative [Tetrahymena thermophila SB210]EAR90955.2 transmembrane protein, putative [Tetrahymena thermophila SB210]|eukprot:XP_001011200.2 transmembrane protein, putative [Tetrahymena thermophila SB210]